MTARRSPPPQSVDLFAKNPPPVLLTHFVGDAGSRQLHELSERRIRPARPARQRGNETGHGSVAVTVERPQVNRIRGAASRAAGGVLIPGLLS